MTWLDLASAAVPVLLIVGLGLAFIIYYRMIAAQPSQMVLNDNAPLQPAKAAPTAGAVWANALLAGRSPTLHETAVVACGDLVLEGDHLFRQALKVRGGGLSVKGRALFEAAVIVEGNVTVSGEAVFKGGLLTHGEYVVHGRAQCGPWLRTARDARNQHVSAA